MKEDKILNSIKSSVNNAPIDLLESIKSQDIPRMIKHDDITRQKQDKRVIKTIMPLMSLAAALILVFGLWQFNYGSPDTYVYLDVNPSVEIITNKRDEVINILAYNSDGGLLIDDIDFKGRDVVLVTEEIIMNMVDSGYIKSSDDYLLLSVYNKNDEKQKSQQERLNTSIHNFMGKEEFVPIVLLQNLEKTSTIESFASEYGISLSKMTFIRNMIILNPELEVEELVELSLKELINVSQSMELDLKSIIESDDFDRIPEYKPVEQDDTDDDHIDNGHNDDDYYEDDDNDDDDDDNDDDDDDDDIVDNIPRLSERKIISAEEAKRIALSLTNGGKIKSLDLDYDEDDNEAEYEIEIKKDNKTYEIKLDGYTGRVLDFETDEDD